MRALVILLIFVFSSSNLFASDYCFEKYGLETDRDKLKYQYAISNGNISKELTFRIGEGLLSVLIFEKRTTQNEVTEKFELLLATKYRASELAQINPTTLRQNYDFAKKLVFPKQQNEQRHDSYLLFSKNGCTIIFKQEIMATTNNQTAVSALIDKVKLFSEL